MELRAYVEAAIDFPDEDAEFLAAPEVRDRLAEINARFATIGETVRQGRALRDGLHVVIAGRPNAGKSSLLNALAGFDAAIVTEIPGTTRDLLRERIHVDGLPIHVVDTAGLRDTDDVIEIEGLRRARMEMSHADLVLLRRGRDARLRRGRAGATPGGHGDGHRVEQVGPAGRASRPTLEDRPAIALSALTGDGMPALREQLKAAAGYQSESGAWSARRRHLDALERAKSLFQLADRAPRRARFLRAGRGGTARGASRARRDHGRRIERRAARRGVRDLLHREVAQKLNCPQRNTMKP